MLAAVDLAAGVRGEAIDGEAILRAGGVEGRGGTGTDPAHLGVSGSRACDDRTGPRPARHRQRRCRSAHPRSQSDGKAAVPIPAAA